MVIDLRSLFFLSSFSAGCLIYQNLTSTDVRRQILTHKEGPHAERVKEHYILSARVIWSDHMTQTQLLSLHGLGLDDTIYLSRYLFSGDFLSCSLLIVL